jgi:hypothetical protein
MKAEVNIETAVNQPKWGFSEVAADEARNNLVEDQDSLDGEVLLPKNIRVEFDHGWLTISVG